MKKFFALALSLALALTAFAGCSSTSASASTPSAASGSTAGSAGTAASGELNLYTWEGMFPQEVLDAFTAETGGKGELFQLRYRRDHAGKAGDRQGRRL